MKRAIIFDFDGTIADSLTAVVQVFEGLTRRPQSFTTAEIKSMRHQSLIDLMLDLKVPRWKVPMLLFRGRRMIRDHLSSIKVHPGIKPVLEALHANGEQMYILSSNSTENVRKYLRDQGLEQYFTAISGGASLFGKARHLHKLLAGEQIDVARSWYVGDETRDIIAAHAVGLRVVSVSWGYNSREALTDKAPDVLIDTPAELVNALKK